MVQEMYIQMNSRIPMNMNPLETADCYDNVHTATCHDQLSAIRKICIQSSEANALRSVENVEEIQMFNYNQKCYPSLKSV